VTLIPRERLIPLLACPRCGAALEDAGTRLDCRGTERHSFAELHGHPVLVDFERSVIDRDALFAAAGASAVPRPVASRPRLRALLDAVTPDGGDRGVARRVLERLRAGGARPRVLVIGGATASGELRALYVDRDIDTIGFDIYGSSLVQFIADAHAIPLADEIVDAVCIPAVLEHVLDPWRVVAETHRVLRPGGLVFSQMPFMQQVHEGAYDFVRLSERGQRWLFRWFDEVESGIVAGPGTTLAWSVDHFVRALTRSKTAGRIAGLSLSWLGWLEPLMNRAHALDGASCLWFVGRRAECPLEMRALLRGYRGAQRTGGVG